MSNEATEFYLNILKDLLKENFERDSYCVGDSRDSAVCLAKENGRWIVFGCNRLARIDEEGFENIIEAAMEMLSRLSDEKEEASLKSDYFMKIYHHKIA